MLNFISLTIGLCWDHAGSAGYVTLTSLTTWLRWEQAGSGGSGFAGRHETSFTGSNGSGFTGWGETGFAGSSGSGFAGSKLVVVECSLSPL
jgi:hypothetical protein